VSSGGFTAHYCEYHIPAELGLQSLGPLLGSGSFGKVFRGINADRRAVALKVVDCRQREHETIAAQIREVQLSCALDHPRLVKVLGYATSTDMAGGNQLDILWLVQELCDLGTCTSCSERGFLRVERQLTSPPNMIAVLRTLHDIADAMAFVHSRGIVHGDLTGRNVLLSTSECNELGFIAKVGDFGLSQYTCGRAFATKVLGTITHMPPELLRVQNQVLVPEGDVWAFGIIAWEAIHGKCCYRGKSAPQIVIAVVRNRPLEWAATAPDDFVSLMKQCLAYEYAERLSFSNVAAHLQRLERGLSVSART